MKASSSRKVVFRLAKVRECRLTACFSVLPGGRTRRIDPSAIRTPETLCCRCMLSTELPVGLLSLAHALGHPRASFRYNLDMVSRNLSFEKTDSSLLGCGSSAVVYKGMLDGGPVAVKV